MHRNFENCLDTNLIRILARDLEVKKSEVIPILQEFFTCTVLGDKPLNRNGQCNLLFYLRAKNITEYKKLKGNKGISNRLVKWLKAMSRHYLEEPVDLTISFDDNISRDKFIILTIIKNFYDEYKKSGKKASSRAVKINSKNNEYEHVYRKYKNVLQEMDYTIFYDNNEIDNRWKIVFQFDNITRVNNFLKCVTMDTLVEDSKVMKSIKDDTEEVYKLYMFCLECIGIKAKQQMITGYNPKHS